MLNCTQEPISVNFGLKCNFYLNIHTNFICARQPFYSGHGVPGALKKREVYTAEPTHDFPAMGLPEIFRVTWQLCIGLDVSSALGHNKHFSRCQGNIDFRPPLASNSSIPIVLRIYSYPTRYACGHTHFLHGLDTVKCQPSLSLTAHFRVNKHLGFKVVYLEWKILQPWHSVPQYACERQPTKQGTFP